MENNIPTNPIIQAQTPIPPMPTQSVPPMPQQPQPQQMPPQSVPSGHKSHLMRMLLIIIAFFLIVGLCIYFYFSFFNKGVTDSTSIKIENAISPTAPVSVKNADEEELNNIDVGDVDVDLKDVDADLQQL